MSSQANDHRHGASQATMTTTASLQQPSSHQHRPSDYITPQEVIRRIEELVEVAIEDLDDEILPVLRTYQDDNDEDHDDEDDHAHGGTSPKEMTKSLLKSNQDRSYTSIFLVLSFCHNLLLSRRTTTTREVYYHYVTHFRSQKECDAAISEAAMLLQVSRHHLGLKASPKGWFCGDIQLVQTRHHTNDMDNESDNSNDSATPQPQQVILDGRAPQSIHGSPISSEWLSPPTQRNFQAQTTQATCILVIEKEGVYNRLLEDKFFQDYPCILVTGKGFPDMSTRAMVHALHTELGLPVWGLADCNPYGVMVLHTYMYSQGRGGRGSRAVDGGDRYGVPMQWLGLRPSQVEQLRKPDSDTHTTNKSSLPEAVFQQMSDRDSNLLTKTLLNEDNPHRWTDFGRNESRMEELEDMLDNRYKAEIEALNWLGMEYIAKWLGRIFDHYLEENEAGDDSSSQNDGEEAFCLEII